MKKPGRPSSASLGVITALPQRLPPPPGLTAAQASIWLAVVGSRPAGHFDAAAGHLLEAYCGAVASADLISKLVDDFKSERLADPAGLRQFGRLLAVRDRLTRQMLALARSLRLTTQSTRRADSAANRSVTPGTRRPWEIGPAGGDEPA